MRHGDNEMRPSQFVMVLASAHVFCLDRREHDAGFTRSRHQTRSIGHPETSDRKVWSDSYTLAGGAYVRYLDVTHFCCSRGVLSGPQVLCADVCARTDYET